MFGVPVLPLAVPGAADSPGTSNCIFVNAPALTGMAELTLALLLESEASDAVTVWLPAVLNVTLKFVFVPATSAALAGNVALLSLEEIETVSVTVATVFQFASTALTVMFVAVPAVCAVGEPVLPVAVPGAAVSAGASVRT